MTVEVTAPNNAPQALGVAEAGKAIAARLRSAPEKVEPEPPTEGGDEETEAVEAKEAAEEPGDETRKADDEESSPAEFESLDQLIEAAFGDKSADALKKLKVKVKTNGKEEETTLEDALSGYSRTGDYTQKQQKLAQDRKELYEAQTKVHDDYARSVKYAVDVVRSNAEQYESYLQSQPLLELKTKDPARYLLARDEIQQKLASFKQIEAKANQDWAQRVEQYRVATAEYTFGRVKEKRPGFAHEDAKRAMKELEGYGYSTQELQELTDFRPALLAVELAEARDKIAEYEARTKKGEASIRTIKPSGTLKPGGAKQPRTEAQKAQFERMTSINKLRESGSVEDAGKALSVRLFGARKGK